MVMLLNVMLVFCTVWLKLACGMRVQPAVVKENSGQAVAGPLAL